ncbi:MAG: riboflavin synthase subunit alpha [Gammaproteobacteria bacterium]|jgi:riboflavin synthase|uniref:Riboflavin synthase n=1 Tax=Marinomonas polaris DSM 16579 TaxID=1122206 RepID=A0A1M5C1D8_9GAMM|nr:MULTISPECIES: riboflavin synthase subunit alpha [Marinomonas]MBU1294553.1 riboflavin synthase subunit alpha [Gammaproteobacteria bacterium]MBU1465200.1 riboflavin synthase subunit alpha [Gammaproteobacteria bacterium]MBU2024534.1 riboflavin synthase subunit alpha [Gammaproteobacteria bacterium]MBU2238215.1 riboflavin synthase subunit alpha [Gammaproteobacteria bacterium]MBU2319900.1 riboflavin synthase subunit alpha [Gammaproteobacteria bacterium]|tara:strand:- start:2979 stop:3611 length:633 start_codon:yes stop_codon:yes gene_type:complete
MFTGIVQGKATVQAESQVGRNKRLEIVFPAGVMLSQQLGASVAINGVCLTVAEIGHDVLTFDVIDTTLALTNIGLLQTGDVVNFERAAKMGDEIGGHVMSGHIMTSVTVSRIEKIEESVHIRFTTDRQNEVDARRYLFNKGYVGLNGASLTISDIGNDWLEVSLIPETLRLTTFSSLTVGDKVNLEIDAHTQATVDTVERILKERGIVLP